MNMKKLTIKNNKSVDACIVDSIWGDISIVKTNYSELIPIIFKGVITKLRVKKYKEFTFVSLIINNDGYLVKSILVKQDDVDNLLKILVIGKQYKFKGCMRKVLLRNLYIIKEIEIGGK